MKKILLVVPSILLILTGYSQTLQSVTDNGNTTTNKLGIKISSPDYYFDHKITNNLSGIEKVFRISTYGGTNFSRRFNMEVLGNGANANDFYQIFGGELHSSSAIGSPVFATYENWSGFAWEWRGSSSDNLTLYGIESSTTGSPASIKNTIINFNAVTGKVGIGNTNPDADLTIGGKELITYNLKIKDQVGRAIEIISPTEGSAIGRLKITDTNSNLRLGVNSFPDAFHIHGANGNIGIVSTNPDATLTIGGKELVTYNLKIKDQVGRAIELISPTVSSPVGKLKITDTNSSLQLGVRDFPETIHIKGDDGYVGIGTTNPKSKLAVDGQIRATEVKVLADISVPDYVFEPDYELRTLKETKEYIAENKHLPEIPSASEIGENGIDLGDMNMRLLKKIEELTLYQIELLEKLEQQNERLQEVEKELQTLKK